MGVGGEERASQVILIENLKGFYLCLNSDMILV